MDFGYVYCEAQAGGLFSLKPLPRAYTKINNYNVQKIEGLRQIFLWYLNYLSVLHRYLNTYLSCLLFISVFGYQSKFYLVFAEIYLSIMRSKVVTLLLVSLFSSRAASGQWTEHDYLVSSASGRDDEEATGS